MYKFNSVELKEFIVHKVGNISKDEGLILSYNFITPTPEQSGALLSLFLNPFKTEDYFKFELDRENNLVYDYIASINEMPYDFVQITQALAEDYYKTTIDPKVISGDFYVVKFDNIVVDDEVVSAVGLFKTETTETYIKLDIEENLINPEREEGVSLKKMDRGLLVINTEKYNGYKILYVDKTKTKQHWLEFLKIERINSSFQSTSNFIDTFNGTLYDMIDNETMNHRDKAKIIQNTEAYFKNEDVFNIDSFKEEVFENNKDALKEFESETKNYEEKTDLSLSEDFEISKTAVKSRQNMFKNILKLDNNFKVEILNDTTEIEEGYDANRNKKYFKIYYDDVK